MEKECMCVVSKVNLTWLAASGISELPRGAADILYKLFPLSWYIKQLCSAAKKLIWSSLRKCDKLMESFPFSFRLWDDLSALCGKFCFFYSVVLIMRTQIYLQIFFPEFHAGKKLISWSFQQSWNKVAFYFEELEPKCSLLEDFAVGEKSWGVAWWEHEWILQSFHAQNPWNERNLVWGWALGVHFQSGSLPVPLEGDFQPGSSSCGIQQHRGIPGGPLAPSFALDELWEH